MNDVNRQWRVARRPDGNVTAADFEYREQPVPEPGDGEMLLRVHYLNLAPVMRMYMSGKSAAGEAPLAIGDVIHGRGVAEVIESRHPEYEPGDFVQGQTGWQTYKVTAATPRERFRRVPDRGIPYSIGLSTFGMTGFSAYFGFIDCGRPRADDVIVVSGAAGGVGSQVVQLAKAHCKRVIGIAGGPDKCRFIESLGCDVAVDYKAGNVPADLAAACPDGIDLYFDNVGGEILSACLENLAQDSRVVLCGSISEYLRDAPFGLTNYTNLRVTNSTMQGFFVYNHLDEVDRAERDLGAWVDAGALRPVEYVFDGFESMPGALASMYDGGNVGVSLCRIRQSPYDEREAIPATL